MANRPDNEVELDRLELRFAATRVSDARAVQRLVQSIDACGQLIACVAVVRSPPVSSPPVPDPDEQADAPPLVLIDGYRRVAALRELGRDTAWVQCWRCPSVQALAQVLGRARSRAFTAIEEALLLRELIDAHGLTQREAARQCGRDVSWVQRRLHAARRDCPRRCCRRCASARVSTLGRDARVRAVGARQQRARSSSCWPAWASRSGCPRASCTPGSSTTRVPSARSANAWSSTRGCSSTASNERERDARCQATARRARAQAMAAFGHLQAAARACAPPARALEHARAGAAGARLPARARGAARRGARTEEIVR